MPELIPTDAWTGMTDPTTGEPWRSSLADALRANGFETSPPPIDDGPDAWSLPAATADEGSDVAAPPLSPDADPGSGWWLDASALPEPVALAAATPPAMPDAAPRPLNAPAGQAAATPPSPPAFLAARFARSAAPAAPPDVAPAPPEPEPVAVTEPVAVAELIAVAEPVAVAEPAAFELPIDDVPEDAQPDDPVLAGLDPRVALAWPEPKPLNDEGWPDAPLPPGLVEAGSSADAAPASTDASARGFAWDEPTSATAATQDPWAGVRFSAGDAVPEAVTDDAGADAFESEPAMPAAAAAAAAAALATDAEPAATAESAWISFDAPVTADEPVAEAAPWATPAPWEPEHEPWSEPAPAPQAEAAPWDPAPTAPDWVVPAAAAAPWEPGPAEPETAAVTTEPAGGSPIDLDPDRMEYVGYVDPATVRPIIPPNGSILDVSRRPPGAKPVDPATLGMRSSTSGAAAASDAVPATPGATGADLWDLVTAPTPPAVPEKAASGGSRAVSVLLSLLVVLVIVALVVGFLYSFTGLL